MDEMTYFQFLVEKKLPIYIRVDLGAFHSELEDFLEVHGFQKLAKERVTEISKSMEKTLTGRMLTIRPAAPSVARQIDGIVESDQYGEESVIPKTGYRVYRYKNHGLLVYSFAATEWELGCFEHFGSKDFQLEGNIVLNRFLSLALSSQSHIGFWGNYSNGQLAVLKKSESNGEVVFVNVQTHEAIVRGTVHQLSSHFNFVRYVTDSKRDVRMSPENLLGFLSSRCSYLDNQGLSVPVRQMLQRAVKKFTGMEIPVESSKISKDLSPS